MSGQRRGIRSGELRTRLTIQKQTTSNHAVTNEVITDSWADVTSFYAKELVSTSNEVFEGRQQVASEERRFFCRWGSIYRAITADSTLITADSTSITADSLSGVIKVINERMRLNKKGEIFNIKGIDGGGLEGFAIIKAERRG